MARRIATLPAQFHVGLHTVHACDSSPLALAAVLGYLHRRNESDVRDRCALVDAQSYMLRLKQHADAKAAVVGHRFFCHGSMSEDEVWAGVDQAARTKSGRYHRRAGGKPRLAMLGELSLPWDLPEAEKVRLSHAISQKIVDEYGAAVTCVCHLKLDQPERGLDHVHLLISMREVDAKGIGTMIRAFNGMASRRGSDERVVVGKRTLAAFPIWLRQQWAELLTEATGREYSPWSYLDQGLDLEPCRPFTRAAIEQDRKNGGLLLAQREVFLAERNTAFLRRANARSRRGEALPGDASLAAKVAASDRRLAQYTAISPMAKVAIMARTTQRAGASVASARRQCETAQPSSITASIVARAKPREEAPAGLQAERYSKAETATTRPVVAVGPSATQAERSDPKAVESTLVSRQWAALYNKERKANTARWLEERDAEAKRVRRPSPPLTLRILGEGGLDGAGASQIGRHDTLRHQRGPMAGPATCAVDFGAALIVSGWRTEAGEAQLASAVGWERGAFAAATAEKAADMRHSSLSPTHVRDLAREAAPTDLRGLFERLEAERREAKREGDNARKAVRNQKATDDRNAAAGSTSLMHKAANSVGAEEESAKAPLLHGKQTAGHELGEPLAPHPSTIHQPKSDESSTIGDRRPGLHAQAEPSDELVGEHADNMTAPRMASRDETMGVGGKAPERAQPIDRSSNPETPPSLPCSRERFIETVLDLAALLLRRGRLQSHIETICSMCEMTREHVMKELACRVQTFDRHKDRTGAFTTRILARARGIDDQRIDQLIDALTSRPDGLKTSRSVFGEIPRNRPGEGRTD